jgi:hypothetical protein
MPRELQCVASLGVLSSVLTMTASMCASSIVRGAPERGASRSPSIRCPMNRWRQLPTVSLSILSRVATSRFSPPCVQARTIRARNASACPVLRRDASAFRSARSISSNSNAAKRRPPIANPSENQGVAYN